MTVKTNSPFRHFPRWLAVFLTATLMALPATAESSPQDGTAFASQRSALAMADCGQARDAARCLAMQQARDACQEKRGTARRRCLRERMPAPDCAKAPDPRRCLALQEAHRACQGKPGKALRKCLRNYSPATLPPPPISSIN